MKLRAYLCSGAALCLFLLPFTAQAAGTNTIPYMDSFEGYTPGYSIADENGWYLGTPIDIAVITNVPDHGLTSPYMPSAPHTKVVDLAGTVFNNFVPSPLNQAYVDIMIKPEASNPPETMDPVPQIAAYVNVDNQIVFYHSYYDSVSGLYLLTWTTNDVDVVPTNEWTRLTFTLDYRSSPTYLDSYFQIQVNGGAPYSNSLAYDAPGDNDAPNAGTWFMAANTDPLIHGGSSYQTLNSISVDGIAQLDDLVVYDSLPSPSEYTTNGTPHAWLDYYGLVTGGDYDAADWYDEGDGMAAWEEYYAGTDPTNPDSVLRILSVDTDWRIVWFGGTNGSPDPYDLYMSTNLLLSQGGWLWLTNRPRSATPTNEWIHTQGAGYPRIFYKVTAPTD